MIGVKQISDCIFKKLYNIQMTTTKINNVSAAFFHSRATEVTEHSMNSTFGQRACSVHVSPHVVSMPYMTVTRDSECTARLLSR